MKIEHAVQTSAIYADVVLPGAAKIAKLNAGEAVELLLRQSAKIIIGGVTYSVDAIRVKKA